LTQGRKSSLQKRMTETANRQYNKKQQHSGDNTITTVLPPLRLPRLDNQQKPPQTTTQQQ